MAEPALRFSKADFDRVPQDLRVELIDGQFLKMPFPIVRHQEIVKRLGFALAAAIGQDYIQFGPIGFVVDDYNVLGPDLVGFDKGAAPDPDACDIDKAALIIEVLSPSTALRDRNTKARLYLGAGVGEVWLIDGASRTVEIRSSRERRVFANDQTASSEVLPAFSFRLSDLF